MNARITATAPEREQKKCVSLGKVYLLKALLFYLIEYLEAAKTVLIVNGVVVVFKYNIL